MSLGELSLWLVSPKFWISENFTDWEDVSKSHTNVRFPKHSDLIYKLGPSILIFAALRYFMIRYIFEPIGHNLKINAEKSRKAPYNAFLEGVYKERGPLVLKTPKSVQEIRKQTGLTENQMRTWLKFRQNQDEISDLDKFTEDCWLMLVYSAFGAWGYSTLRNEPFLYDLNLSYVGYPVQSVTISQEIYMMVGLAFYFVDTYVLIVKRHVTLDFKMRVYHHIIAVGLFCTTWISNLVRFMCVIFFVLDSTSPVACAGKMAEWLKFRSMSKFFFTLLLVQWFFVRGFWYNFIALPSAIIRRPYFSKPVPSFYVLDIFLLALLVANFHWLKIIYFKAGKALKTGEFFQIKLSNESWEELAKALAPLEGPKTK